jgi:hypothetical protein
MEKLAKEFANMMTDRMRSETAYHTRRTFLGYVADVRGPVLKVNGRRMPRAAYRVAKNVSLRNLRVNDEVMLVQTERGTLVLTAVMRSDGDTGDDSRIDGKMVVTGPATFRGVVDAQGGIVLKRVEGAVSDASFSNSPPSGAVAVDVANSRLYVKVGATWKYADLT